MAGELLSHLLLDVPPAKLPNSNPLGCAVAMTALDVLVEEKLSQRADVLGEKFRAAIRAINSPLVKEVRGRGLLNAVIIDEESSSKGRTAWQLCLLLKSRGVLAKPTHVNMYVYTAAQSGGRTYMLMLLPHLASASRHPWSSLRRIS